MACLIYFRYFNWMVMFLIVQFGPFWSFASWDIHFCQSCLLRGPGSILLQVLIWVKSGSIWVLCQLLLFSRQNWGYYSVSGSHHVITILYTSAPHMVLVGQIQFVGLLSFGSAFIPFKISQSGLSSCQARLAKLDVTRLYLECFHTIRFTFW